MRAQTVTLNSVSTSPVLIPNVNVTPFNIGFGVKITGTVTYNVEHTFDDVFDPLATLTWFQHSTVTAQSTNKDSNYAFPVRGIRLNVTAASAATATLTIVQAGIA